MSAPADWWYLVCVCCKEVMRKQGPTYWRKYMGCPKCSLCGNCMTLCVRCDGYTVCVCNPPHIETCRQCTRRLANP